MVVQLCSETLKELETGRELRCSRCKLTYYKDRDAQKRHWKIHKASCAPTTDAEKARIDALSLTQASKVFCASLIVDHPDAAAPGARHSTVYLMQHIRKLYDEQASDPDDVELELHAACRGMLLAKSSLTIAKFYARPGMTTYLLLGRTAAPDNDDDSSNNNEDLLNAKMRLLKTELADYNGLVPTVEYIQYFITDNTEQERVKSVVKRVEEDEEGAFGLQSSAMQFCYLYYNCIVAAATHQPQPCPTSIHDGAGTLRSTGLVPVLAQKALARAMALWSDPHVRASCGDALAPAASLACAALKAEQSGSSRGLEEKKSSGEDDDDDKQLVLIPGLTLDAAILTSLGEIEDQAASAQYSLQLLKQIQELEVFKAYNLWCSMPLEKRAKVARAVVQHILDNEGEPVDDLLPASVRPKVVPKLTSRDLLFMAINTEDDQGHDVFTDVCEIAATDEALGPRPCGGNEEARAFFYYLLKHADDDEPRTAASTIDAWLKTPWPKRHGNNSIRNSPQSLEKVCCMELAQGHELHAEWCKWMSIV